jgi:hypothetical protein
MRSRPSNVLATSQPDPSREPLAHRHGGAPVTMKADAAIEYDGNSGHYVVQFLGCRGTVKVVVYATREEAEAESDTRIQKNYILNSENLLDTDQTEGKI